MSQPSATGDGSVGGDGIRPSRFNGKTSFGSWKMKVLAYLQAIGIRDVVIKDPGLFRVGGSDSPPTIEGVNAAKIRTFKLKQSEKAYSLILNLLEDELIDLVVTVESGDAFMLWKTLLDTFESQSTARLCSILGSFMNIRYLQDRETCDQFKSRYNKLLKQVKDMGEHVSLAIQRYVLLQSLPPALDGLAQSLRINDDISIEQMFIHIKDSVESIGFKRMGRVQEVGMYSSDKSKPRRCYVCGSKDHILKDCPKKYKDDDEDGSDSGRSKKRKKEEDVDETEHWA